MIKEVIILQGCPACGKSTWAKKFIKHNYLTHVIISRDNIRESLGVYWVPSREKLIEDLEVSMVMTAIKNKYSIILDSTNLNPKTISKWENIFKHYPEYTIYYKYFEVSFFKAYLRDIKRRIFGKRAVGYKVLKNFYKNYIWKKDI
jgi:predicted kinase